MMMVMMTVMIIMTSAKVVMMTMLTLMLVLLLVVMVGAMMMMVLPKSTSTFRRQHHDQHHRARDTTLNSTNARVVNKVLHAYFESVPVPRFHIYTNSHGEVCAERTDHRDPWGSNLVRISASHTTSLSW